MACGVVVERGAEALGLVSLSAWCVLFFRRRNRHVNNVGGNLASKFNFSGLQSPS